MRYIHNMKNLKALSLCLIFAAILSLVACTDDDSFTRSTNNRLTFSVDTLRMDTTFSRIPTATKTFWVYNRSGNGIRLSNVRLEKGNQTGFRVNVDGIYLGQSSGFQVNDLEVRNKDSIRVFVELTSSTTGKEDPTLIEDNLLFTLESGVQQKVNLNAYSWDAEVIDDWEIKNDTSIQSTRPIMVRKSITIARHASLHIGAGTKIYFANSAGIDVYGQLFIDGTAENNVVLRGNRLDNMFDYLPYDRVSGQWRGIHFYESSYGNQILYTDLHSAYNGIVCDSANVEYLKVALKYSTVHNCQGYGIFAVNSRLQIYNSQISNTLNDCLAIVGGHTVIAHSTLAQFYPFDSKRGYAFSLTDTYNGKEYGLNIFKMQNTLATAYAADAILIALKNEKNKNYIFENTILRKSKPKEINAQRYKNIIWEETTDTVSGGEKNFVKVDAEKQAYDFHLSEKSKARDAGVTLSLGISTTDRDGTTRSGNPDIGCYEYVAPKK